MDIIIPLIPHIFMALGTVQDQHRRDHWKRCADQYDKHIDNQKKEAEQREKWRVDEHTRQKEMKKNEHYRKMREQETQKRDKMELMRLEHEHTIERLEKEKEKKEVEKEIKKMETDKQMRKMEMDNKKEMRKMELEELRLKVELAKIEKENNWENSHIPDSKQSSNIRQRFRPSHQVH